MNIDEATLAAFCSKHHIRTLSLFGSQRKGMAQQSSDIDLRTAKDLSRYFSDEVVRTAEVQHAR